MFLCKECLTCGHDWHGSGSRGPCESCRQFSVTADCHHATLGTHESIRTKKARLETERKEGVVNHLRDSRTGQIIAEDELKELARIPILEDEIGRLQRELGEAESRGDRWKNYHDMSVQSERDLRQQVKGLQEALEGIRECAHGIMPAHRDHENDLKERILGLKDARWTRLDAILYAAETALATSTPVGEGKEKEWKTCFRAINYKSFKFACQAPWTLGHEEHTFHIPSKLTEPYRTFSHQPETTVVCPCLEQRAIQCNPCRVHDTHSPQCTGCKPSGTLTPPVEKPEVTDSKWCDVCKLYHAADATSWSHAVKKSELKEGYQNSEQTNTLGIMKWCENCHGYHDPNGPHPAGSAR